jgi:sterol desaturase/sphingolipid hydroxylase (fatty acid hydroxylase superfamily)
MENALLILLVSFFGILVVLDFAFYLQHVLFHRIHHSVKRRETDSNFGFNMPW